MSIRQNKRKVLKRVFTKGLGKQIRCMGLESLGGLRAGLMKVIGLMMSRLALVSLILKVEMNTQGNF